MNRPGNLGLGALGLGPGCECLTRVRAGCWRPGCTPSWEYEEAAARKQAAAGAYPLNSVAGGLAPRLRRGVFKPGARQQSRLREARTAVLAHLGLSWVQGFHACDFSAGLGWPRKPGLWVAHVPHVGPRAASASCASWAAPPWLVRQSCGFGLGAQSVKARAARTSVIAR